ncbi:MAG TPA: hypothetical protein VFB60_23380 [Ktedonobacteraceae bacterium]|nr:hypothetical protein [Ktedonobacteraceae bacterium]
MTREYNEQRRDDSRPSFRNKSSNRDEERYSRTNRPRLSREAVDRGWESGAQQRHADYRPRYNNGQMPRNNRRSEHPSTHNDRGHGPYNRRQEDYQDASRRYDRPHKSYQRARPQASGDTRRNFAEPHGERRGYSERQGSRPDFRNGPEARGHSAQPYRQRYDNRRYNDERDRPARDFGSERRGGSFRKRDYDRPRRGPDTQNPRWQSRPQTFSRRSFNERERPPFQGQFEGDYEWFDDNDAYDAPARGDRRPDASNGRDNPTHHDQYASKDEERHVTQLPDGRVIKGSRPQQRKEARFWTNINEDTEALLQRAQPSEDVNGEQELPDEAENIASIETEQEAPRRKVRREAKPASTKADRRAASTSARRRKAAPSSKDALATTRVPRPSQRGFKWPTP